MKINNLEIPKIALIAIAGLIFGIFYIITSAKHTVELTPIREPVKKDFPSSISGVGIVEAYGQNILVSSGRSGKVKAVYVTEGEFVKEGQPLFLLDIDQLNAELNTLEDNATTQKIEIERLKHLPRPEDVPPLQAKVQEAQAVYNDTKTYNQRLKSLYDSGAVSQNDYTQSLYNYQKATAGLNKAKADLKNLNAGAWKYQIRASKSQYQSLVSRATETKVAIGKSTVYAPRDGEVLKVNVHNGEYVAVGVSSTNKDKDAPLILGSSKKLQVRIDIDEINASKFRPGARAFATIKGNAELKFPLKFKKILPFMVPKTNLSGSSTERVDVRVLQVIYEFDPPKFPVYVGQQVDVYIENSPRNPK
jgi:multidrug efflux pump subunit AcrA (membrane-fusion protein)